MMEAKKAIAKTREYLDYLEEHLDNVQKAWEIVKTKCEDMRFIYEDYYYFTLLEEVIRHDMSKFEPAEFVQCRRKFYPASGEQVSEFEFEDALKHHYENNTHHWENWTKKKDKNNPNEWEIHCVHMVIDWMAMGMKYGDTAQEFYEKNKGEITLSDKAEKFIYQIFERIKKEEKEPEGDK